MLTNRIKNYIFDLDGTIIDSSNEVFKCLKFAFKNNNIIVPEDRYLAKIIGPPLQDIIVNLANEIKDNISLITKIENDYRAVYDYETDDISTVYSGVIDLLKKLRSLGKNMFIATFKPSLAAKRVLNQFDLLKYFNDIYCIDTIDAIISKGDLITAIIQKYNLKENETIMIGDTNSDMIAAQKANIIGIGVLWGYSSNKTDLIENADYTVKEAKEILGI